MNKNYCTLFIFVAIIAMMAVMPVSAYVAAPAISPGAMVYLGEQGLNVPCNTIGWWSSATPLSLPPSKTLSFSDPSNVYINPSFFSGTGNWYCLGGGGVLFNVADPGIDILIWDATKSQDVTNKEVAIGDRLVFIINTNMYQALNPYSRSPVYGDYRDGYIDIEVRDPSGTTISKLYSLGGRTQRLTQLNVNTQPWIWGDGKTVFWATNAIDENTHSDAYPLGTYTIIAKSNLNGMLYSYTMGGAPYTGKTVSTVKTINLVKKKEIGVFSVSITANKKSIDRPNPFSVTITGAPESTYFVWIENTNGMDINTPDNAPPIVTPGQTEVYQGNTYASGYHFSNGFVVGKSVGDVTYGSCPSGVPRGDNGCSYSYAAINTDTKGKRTIQFSTSANTKVQAYSIRVEQNNYLYGFSGASVYVNVGATKV